jgi:group I intron endonuclease
MYLYKISFTTTQKIYIGITSKPVELRLAAHTAPSTRSLISNAIRKHGNPTIEVLYQTDNWEELCVKEVEYILNHNSLTPNGYNVSKGGEGSLGVIKSIETRQKISDALKGKPVSDSAKLHIQKISLMNVGKSRSEETKRKISEAQVGKVVSIETRRKISEANTGRVQNEETKYKISQGLTGRICSEETRMKLSLAHRNRSEEVQQKYIGRTHSEETRQKIGVKHKGKIVTEETRSKQSKAAKNRPPISEETRLKRSLALKEYHRNK